MLASRIVPLWGGVAAGGFAEVLARKNRKLTGGEWAKAVRAGKLQRACKQLHKKRKNGPWHVLCDNESFLRSRVAQAAYAAQKIVLWKLPPRSPDLNPVDRFWGWLRRRMRQRDLQDLYAGRPPLGPTAYRLRLRAVCKSKKAQQVARACALGLRRVCQELVSKGTGAATSG